MSVNTKDTHTRVNATIRIRGIVQGVGFRPTIWRIANECDLVGEVLNDTNGVLIHVSGYLQSVDQFVQRLHAEAPPLARIDAIERTSHNKDLKGNQFRIGASDSGNALTGIAPSLSLILCNCRWLNEVL